MEIEVILNIVISILLAVLSFIGWRLFKAQDKQYQVMHDIREFIHSVDKRVIIIETLIKKE